MIIKKLDDSYFELTDPEGSVSFTLPGYISLVVEGYLHQLFRNPRNLEYIHLPSAFPTLGKVLMAAECYTEGIADKGKILKALDDPELLKKHNLKPKDQTILKDYFLSTTHAPPTITQQLYMKGYGHVADDLDFTSHMPALERTCEVFLEFVRNLKQVT